MISDIFVVKGPSQRVPHHAAGSQKQGLLKRGDLKKKNHTGDLVRLHAREKLAGSRIETETTGRERSSPLQRTGYRDPGNQDAVGSASHVRPRPAVLKDARGNLGIYFIK